MTIVEPLVSNNAKCKASVVSYKSLDDVLSKFCLITTCHGTVAEETPTMLEHNRKDCKQLIGMEKSCKCCLPLHQWALKG